MRKTVNDLENEIQVLLPKNATIQVFPEITELTRELINAGKDVWRVSSYTHSICHLFEKYAKGRSYLHLLGQLDIVEDLVNYTLNKAAQSGEMSCTRRILGPVMELNLAHMEENPQGFIFKPEILNDPKFVERLQSSGEINYSLYMADFCKANNIGEFFPLFVNALRKEEELEPISDEELVKGIFIDVDNTLIEFDGYDSGEFFSRKYKKLPLIEEYALKKMEEGSDVTIFTGGDHQDTLEKMQKANLNSRLFDNIKAKKIYW